MLLFYLRQIFSGLILLPAALPVWVLYLWPAEALGLIYRGVSAVDGVVYYTDPKQHGKIWCWLWGTWQGHALPGAIVLRVKRHRNVIIYNEATFRHEIEHFRQWQALGAVFPILYVILLLIFGYLDHPFETRARAAERY